MGRRTMLTPEVAEALLAALSARCTVADACWVAGVSDRTYRRWRARGEAGEGAFSAFLSAVRRTRALARRDALAIIREAAGRDWRAAAWLVERSDPGNWSARSGARVGRGVGIADTRVAGYFPVTAGISAGPGQG